MIKMDFSSADLGITDFFLISYNIKHYNTAYLESYLIFLAINQCSEASVAGENDLPFVRMVSRFDILLLTAHITS